MLSLLAKLGLDVSGFTRGLDAAKGAAGKAGDESAKSYGGKLKGALFGVGSALAAGAFVTAEFDKIRRAADQADLAGKSIRETLALQEVTERVGDTASLAADDLARLVAEASARLPEENALQQMALQAREVSSAVSGLERTFLGALAAAVKFGRASLDFRDAAKDAVSTFFTAPLGGKDGANGFAGIREAWDKAGMAFRNRQALIAEQNKAEAANPPGKLPRAIPPTVPEKPDAAAKTVPKPSLFTADPRIATPGLASVGLFFGGAGSHLLRQAQRQHDVAQRQLEEMARIRRAILEEL